jgi:hypothetical protein
MLHHIISTAQKVSSNNSAPARARAYDENVVINPDRSILVVLVGLAGRYGKTHCWPSQQKLLTLIREHTGRLLSRRTLNRHLKALERDLFIRRIRRHRRARNGSLELHSTCYVPMIRACQWFIKSARSIAGVVGASMRSQPSTIVRRWASSLALCAVPAPAHRSTTFSKEVIPEGH